MNRTMILLLSGVLFSALPGVAAADGQRNAGAMTKLMILFSWHASRVVPQRVVALEKDWPIVKDAEAAQATRIASEKQLHEAGQRVTELERELRLARDAFRSETSRISRETQPVAGPHAKTAERKAREAQDEPLQLAARRVNQRERDAYHAKLEYGRIARDVREQRRRGAAIAHTDI
jgi:hypothetical protein